jgi:hypothetical protein
MRRPARLAALSLLAACAHASAPRPPADPGERQREELAACHRGALPGWLDDDALAEAQRLDRYGLAVDPNDSFRTGTMSAQPALPQVGARGPSRADLVLAERSEFQARCALVKSAGHGAALPRP